MPFGICTFTTLRYASIATLFLLCTVVTICFFASLFMQQPGPRQRRTCAQMFQFWRSWNGHRFVADRTIVR